MNVPPQRIALSFTCASCKGAQSFGALVKIGTGSCPLCQGISWDMQGSFKGGGGHSFDSKDLAINALGIAAALTLGVGIYSTGTQEREVVRDFSVSGVPSEKVLEFTQHRSASLIIVVKEYLKERAAQREREFEDLVDRAGVDCLFCHRGFLPKSSVHVTSDPVRKALFKYNYFCHTSCKKDWIEFANELSCGACRKGFIPPKKPAQQLKSEPWQAKQWHAEGYCSRRCLENKEAVRECLCCRRVFMIPKVNPLAKRKRAPKSWHSAGFCSKLCEERGESSEALVEDKASRLSKELFLARCPKNHGSQLPLSHKGRRAYCGLCNEPFRVAHS